MSFLCTVGGGKGGEESGWRKGSCLDCIQASLYVSIQQADCGSLFGIETGQGKSLWIKPKPGEAHSGEDSRFPYYNVMGVLMVDSA